DGRSMNDAADLHQEKSADYRVLALSGTHYDIGHGMGRATPLRQIESWRDPEAEIAFAEACAGLVRGVHPPLLDEVRGYAAAQGRAWEEVLPQFSLNLPEGTLSGCTTVAWRLPASGHVMIGRNYDFLYSQRQRYLRQIA